jgi:cytochrome P450/NADPH-cytochrome P450 reductase
VFYEWLKQAPSDSLNGVKYGVFGCGHPDWVATYHAIPKAMDKLLGHAGATRLIARGLGNAAVAELFEEFDDWEAQFMAAIANTQPTGNHETASSEKKTLHVSIDTTRREQTLRLDKMVTATIVSNEIISGTPKEKGEKGYNVKRHIEISLPQGVTYQTGDYLAILPTNPDQTVQRALRRFNLHPDDVLTIHGRSINLPLDVPVSAYELLNGFVELGQPATKRQIEALLQHMPESKGKETLVQFTHEDIYQKELATKRYSLLDILEDYPDIKMEFGDFLLSLPALRVRQVSPTIVIYFEEYSRTDHQYSISSSPLHDPTRCTITISIIASPHLSGHGDFLGTATSYLSSRSPGSPLRAAVRSTSTFRTPLDPSKSIILAGAGSGIAPFRAFLQERSIQK